MAFLVHGAKSRLGSKAPQRHKFYVALLPPRLTSISESLTPLGTSRWCRPIAPQISRPTLNPLPHISHRTTTNFFTASVSSGVDHGPFGWEDQAGYLSQGPMPKEAKLSLDQFLELSKRLVAASWEYENLTGHNPNPNWNMRTSQVIRGDTFSTRSPIVGWNPSLAKLNSDFIKAKLFYDRFLDQVYPAPCGEPVRNRATSPRFSE